MKVNCPSCHKVYNIPEERLPAKKEIAFHCPACKGLITIKLPSKSAKDDSPQLFTTAEQEQVKQSAPAKPSAEKALRGQALKDRIMRRLNDLPVMPQVVPKVQAIMANPNTTVDELVKIIENDQACTTLVLKLTNSAYYGLRGEVASVKQAAVLLGFETLGKFVIMAGASSLLGNTLKGYRLDSEIMWKHSLAVAFGARIIASRKKPELANDAFLAGLIHDIGKIILDEYVFKMREAFDAFTKDEQQTFLSAEKSILGFDHAEIGYEACQSWHFPEAITIAIQYHHDSFLSQENELAYIVHMADSIAMRSVFGVGPDTMRYKTDERVGKLLGLQEKDVHNIMVEVVASVEKVAEEMQKA